MKRKAVLFLKSDKIDKPQARLIKEKRDQIQITRTGSEQVHITTEPKDLTKILRKYYKQLYANTFDNLSKMDTFLQKIFTKTDPRRNRKLEQSYIY